MTTRKTLPLRVAGFAVAAALVQSPMPTLAQDATTDPATAPVVSPPPRIVVPVAEPEPVAAPAPPAVPSATVAEPAAPSPEPRQVRSATPRAASSPPISSPQVRANPGPVAEAAPVQAAAATTEAAPVAPLAVPPPENVAAPEPLLQDAAPADTDGDNTLALAGLLGIVGLGGVGIWAASRRRRLVTAYDQAVPDPAPIMGAPVVPAAAPLSAESFALAPPSSVPRRPSTPAKVDPGDRAGLVAAMAAEPPSAENPFTSRKARKRRARLLLQRREAAGEPLVRQSNAPLHPAFGRELAEA